MRFFKYLLVLLGFVFLSCSASKQTVKSDEPVRAIQEKTSVERNEEFDPLTLGDYRLEIDTAKPLDDTVDIAQLLRSASPADSASEPSKIRGFRVQLISTRNEEEARSVMRNAIISFAEPVYRDYDNPYYKIRVGDFKSRYDASKVQEQAIELGFQEAWVVRALIWDKPPKASSQQADDGDF
ncbi:SPOR domain-containing protein [candidate division KSB1 bacterium]|nr:SPOR domain-containing protein [candidate division KSB1 bacterium]